MNILFAGMEQPEAPIESKPLQSWLRRLLRSSRAPLGRRMPRPALPGASACLKWTFAEGLKAAGRAQPLI